MREKWPKFISLGDYHSIYYREHTFWKFSVFWSHPENDALWYGVHLGWVTIAYLRYW